MKKTIACIMVLILALGLCSCGFGSKTETFTVIGSTGDTMNITLDSDFKQYEPIEAIGTYTAIFDSSDAKIIVIDQPASGVKGLEDVSEDQDITDAMLEFGDEMAATLGLPSGVTYDSEKGLFYVVHDMTVIVTETTCVCYIYYSNGRMWMLEMMCTSERFAEMKPLFDTWAMSVEFSK